LCRYVVPQAQIFGARFSLARRFAHDVQAVPHRWYRAPHAQTRSVLAVLLTSATR
jgi:hypothetical protein